MQHHHWRAKPFIDIVLAQPCVVVETTLEWKEMAKRLETHRHSSLSCFKIPAHFKSDELLH